MMFISHQFYGGNRNAFIIPQLVIASTEAVFVCLGRLLRYRLRLLTSCLRKPFKNLPALLSAHSFLLDFADLLNDAFSPQLLSLSLVIFVNSTVNFYHFIIQLNASMDTLDRALVDSFFGSLVMTPLKVCQLVAVTSSAVSISKQVRFVLVNDLCRTAPQKTHPLPG
jgi:hypothetical protein